MHSYLDVISSQCPHDSSDSLTTDNLTCNTSPFCSPEKMLHLLNTFVWLRSRHYTDPLPCDDTWTDSVVNPHQAHCFSSPSGTFLTPGSSQTKPRVDIFYYVKPFFARIICAVKVKCYVSSAGTLRIGRQSKVNKEKCAQGFFREKTHKWWMREELRGECCATIVDLFPVS